MDAPAPVIASIVHEHAQEASFLFMNRQALVKAPAPRLHGLARHDDRLAAHLDGLAVAEEYGWSVCKSGLDNPGAGDVFLATVRTLETSNGNALAELIDLAEKDTTLRRGLLGAFGWVSAQHLHGKIKALLASENPLLREVGVVTCVMHRVDPGRELEASIAHPEPRLCARTLRAAGQCGRRDLLAGCLAGLGAEDAGCRFEAACSGVLLGDRQAALHGLRQWASAAGPLQRRALRLVLKSMDEGAGHSLLQRLAREAANRRLLIEAAGFAGNPRYVEWLISQMQAPELARLAGEAFTFITGLDLGHTHLLYDREAPADFSPGPTDTPDDENVALDEDDGLPWPDPAKLRAWWEVNHQRFQPGLRYFMGAPPTVEHCRKVLREGYQRQRVAAAEYLCLLAPGTPLFPTSAPAWRQQRWLRQMG